MESLFFSFSFKKIFFYWVLLNNLAKVKSLLCKVILQNSLMKLFFIPFWMLPIHLMYANVDVDCEFSSLIIFIFYAYSRISHVLYTCNNNIPNTLSIEEISSKAFQNFFLLFWMIIHFGVLTQYKCISHKVQTRNGFLQKCDYTKAQGVKMSSPQPFLLKPKKKTLMKIPIPVAKDLKLHFVK